MSKHQRILVVKVVVGSAMTCDLFGKHKVSFGEVGQSFSQGSVTVTAPNEPTICTCQRSNAVLAMLCTTVHNSKIIPLNNPVLKVTLYLCLGCQLCPGCQLCLGCQQCLVCQL